MKIPSKVSRDESALRAIAVKYPGAHEDFPWGERAIKVKGKVFVFMRADENGLVFTAKLTSLHADAMLLPFSAPCGYGMGKHGWVTARFGPKQSAPIPILRAWIDESFRNVAPKKVVAELDGIAPAKKVRAKTTTRR